MTEITQPLLHVYLFGPLRATWQGHSLPGLTRPQLQALWAYLMLLHRHRPAPRERLAFSFWPGSSEAQARASLRQYIYLLRQWLPPSPNGPWLVIDPDKVGIDPQPTLWVDVWAFEDGLTRGEAELEAAVQLVSADLLPDLYDDWLIVERERLRIAYSRALPRLVMLKQSRGERRAALAWAQRLIAYDSWNEEAHCLLIALLYANGSRTAALEQFKECQRILHDEVGVAPIPSTLALRDAIVRSQPLPAPWSSFWDPLENIAVQIPLDVPAPPQPGLPIMPFVGREAELRQLIKQWHETTAPEHGSRSIVLVGGEAGVGKTRLLSELARQVESSGGQVLWGQCYAFERYIPYQPVVEALRAALPQLAASSIPLVWLAEAARLLPDLREMRPDIPEPPRLDPEHAQARLVEGLCRCLLGLADQRPLLLILEDLHWAAVSTLMWLHAMGRQAGSAPVLIVCSYRQEEVGFGHPLREWMREIRRQRWGTLLTLHPLAGDAVQTLVNVLSGLGERAVILARRLQAEVEGNPFFLSELLQHLQEIGQLSSQEGRWAGPWVESAGSGEESQLPLPEGVRDTILSRVERLSEGARELLGYAAVAGREFDLKVVLAAIGWAEEQALKASEELLERGLVRKEALATSRDHGFNHHLVQEVTYEELPRSQRQAYHRQVGEAMAVAYGEGAAGELAHHFEQAGMMEETLKYLKLAGEQAAARYANADALDYYGRALAILPEEAWDTRFDLLAARVTLWHLLGQRQEERINLEVLMATAQALADDRRLARAYILQADLYREQLDPTGTARAAQSALALFRRTSDRHGEAQSLHALGRAIYLQGDFTKSRDYYGQALALRQTIGDRVGAAASLNRMGEVARYLSGYKAAQNYHEQALALARATGDRLGETQSLYQLGRFNQDYMQYRATHDYFEQALALSRAIGWRRLEAYSRAQLAEMSIVTGDFGAAEGYRRQCLLLFQAMGDDDGMAWVFLRTAQVAAQLGDVVAARRMWEEVLSLAQRLDLPWVKNWTLIGLGYLLHQVGERRVGRAYLEQALTPAMLARTGEGPRYRLWGNLLLGQLAWGEGDEVTATACWREAARIGEVVGMTPFVPISQARLAEALAVLGQPAVAHQMAEAVWAAWQAEPPQGEEFDEVRQGYLALARTFARLGEPQAARACLEQAHAFVQGRLAYISDEARRQSFLQVPVNREIAAALEKAV